jgi:hypothetical protein
MDANYRHHSQTDDEFVLFVLRLPSIGDSSQPSSSNKPIHTSKPDMRAGAEPGIGDRGEGGSIKSK